MEFASESREFVTRRSRSAGYIGARVKNSGIMIGGRTGRVLIKCPTRIVLIREKPHNGVVTSTAFLVTVCQCERLPDRSLRMSVPS